MRTSLDKKETAELFSHIADSYDLLNHLLSFNLDRRWRGKLAKLAGSRPGALVLDLCTGTGDVALRLAQKDAKQVIGIDMSDRMLHLNRAKAARAGLRSKEALLKADALNLPFKANVFDGVTVGFGLRNLPERDRAVSEMARVLKKGGWCLVLEFSLPRNWLFSRIYHLYLRRVIPLLGGLLSRSREAYEYLYASILEFSRLDVLALMEAAGLSGLSCTRLSGGLVSLYQGKKEDDGTLLSHCS